jgi:hypothetical protein
MVRVRMRDDGRLHRAAHKSNTAMQHYHPFGGGPPLHLSKPDISPDQRWRIPMKNLILAAFAALSLSAAVAPLASAAAYHNGSTVFGDSVATRMQQTGSYVGGN